MPAAPRKPHEDDKPADDGGAASVQAQVDAEHAKGVRGERVDPTPLENYTLAGVSKGLPTPETDADALAAAREASRHSRG